MSVTSNKYIIQNMERLSFFDNATGLCQFVVDDLQSAEMTNEQETVYATGKNGVRIGSADRNKAARITATNGSIVDGVMAMQVGDTVHVGTVTVPNHFVALTTANGTGVTLELVPHGTVGAEIPYIYKRNADGTIGQSYAIAASASATTFKYDSSTNAITLPTSAFAPGDTVYMFYDIEVANAKKITNQEDKFSSTGKLIADIFAKDICTEKSYYGKIIFPKAKASGNFTLSFGDDPSVQDMEFEALSGGCNSGSTKILWDFIIFDEDDIDEVE